MQEKVKIVLMYKQRMKQQKPIGISASNVVITKLKLDKSRKAILERKNRNMDKTKSKDLDVNMAGVD